MWGLGAGGLPGSKDFLSWVFQTPHGSFACVSLNSEIQRQPCGQVLIALGLFLETQSEQTPSVLLRVFEDLVPSFKSLALEFPEVSCFLQWTLRQSSWALSSSCKSWKWGGGGHLIHSTKDNHLCPCTVPSVSLGYTWSPVNTHTCVHAHPYVRTIRSFC